MSIDDLYQKACDAVERANYDYAVELFREVLRQNPEYPDARIALRGTERRRIQESATSLLTKTAAPLQAALATLKALLARKRKKLEIYEDYLQTHPSSFWGLAHAAAAAAKCGFPQEAANMYRDALKLKPSHKGALRAISDLLRQQGEHQEALKYLSRLASLEPQNRDLQREVRDLEATDHMKVTQMEGATSFRDLIRDRTGAEEAERGRRMAVTFDDLRDQAEQLAKELEENPLHVNRILTLAQTYVDLGQTPKAQKLLRQKHEQMPGNYEIRERLGDTQLRLYDEAIATAGTRAEEAPDDAEARSKKEELQQRRRRFAVKEYAWRLNQHPTDRALQLRLGQAEFEAGQYNEAIAVFQNLGQDPRFEAQAAKMLGRCFTAKEQYDLALQQFERALAHHPEMDEEGKELLYLQAEAQQATGNAEEALKIYKRIYSQDINFRDVARKVDALSA